MCVLAVVRGSVAGAGRDCRKSGSAMHPNRRRRHRRLAPGLRLLGLPGRRRLSQEEEVVMSQLITRRRLLGALEHVLAIVVGFILMVVGLALGVTMIMLPVGLVIGLIGLAMFIGGICVRFEWV